MPMPSKKVEVTSDPQFEQHPRRRFSAAEKLRILGEVDASQDRSAEGKINLDRSLRQPPVVHERMDVLRLMEQLRRSSLHMAIVLDEYGSIEGVVTPIDILEAIAGEFPDDDEQVLPITRQGDGSWVAAGWLDIRRLSQRDGHDLVDEADRYSTLSGFLLWQPGTMPTVGARVSVPGLVFEVVSLEGRSIDQVRITSDARPTP